jgi:hypothetical protein
LGRVGREVDFISRVAHCQGSARDTNTPRIDRAARFRLGARRFEAFRTRFEWLAQARCLQVVAHRDLEEP